MNALAKLFADSANEEVRILSGTSIRQELTAKTHPVAQRTLTTFPDLNEIDVGEWSGRKKVGDPEITTEKLADWRADKFVPPSGETDDAFALRIRRIWSEIRDRATAGESLVVVTSGNPIRIILGEILGIPWRHLLPKMDIDNAGVTTLRVKDGKFFIAGVNDTSHLAGIGVAKIPGT